MPAPTFSARKKPVRVKPRPPIRQLISRVSNSAPYPCSGVMLCDPPHRITPLHVPFEEAMRSPCIEGERSGWVPIQNQKINRP